MVIKINADERLLIARSFEYLARCSKKVSGKLRKSEEQDEIFENPICGVQMSLPSGEYQLVLELKEVKDD